MTLIDFDGDDHNPYDRLTSFTDREEPLDALEKALRWAKPHDFQLLAIKGDAGVGKTFLLEYLRKYVSQRNSKSPGKIDSSSMQKWETILIHLVTPIQSKPDFWSVLIQIESGLERCVSPLHWKNYILYRDKHIENFNKYTSTINANITINVTDHSTLSNTQMHNVYDTQIRTRYVKMMYSIGQRLKNLSKNMNKSLCICVDDCESLVEHDDQEFVQWLEQLLFLPNLAEAASQPLLVIASGRVCPVNPTFHIDELKHFHRKDMQNYLIKQSILAHKSAQLSSEEEELLDTFWELTQGNPFALMLATTHFNKMSNQERTARHLRSNRQLREELRIEYLEKRLLSRLQEPDRTLLEWIPVLRYLDYDVVQEFLQYVSSITSVKLNALSPEQYRHFLSYLFIDWVNESDGEQVEEYPTLHRLLRKTGLEQLRYYPTIKTQLHKYLADYYQKLAASGRSSIRLGQYTNTEDDFSGGEAVSFKAHLEWIYHSLQVSEYQEEAFSAWEGMINTTLNKWDHRQTRQLLEIIQQLEQEDTPLVKTDYIYSKYLFWHARFLEQENQWAKAQAILESAIKRLETSNKSLQINLASYYHEIGITYCLQENWSKALYYFERALALQEQKEATAETVATLTGMSFVYYVTNDIQKALDYSKRALNWYKNGIPSYYSQLLDNIGFLYQEQEKYEESLEYYTRAQYMREKTQDFFYLVQSYSRIGLLFQKKREPAQAIEYYAKALSLYSRELGCSFTMDIEGEVANVLNCFADILEQLANCFAQDGDQVKSLAYRRRAEILRQKNYS